MIKILLDNTKSTVSGDTQEDFKLLRSIRNKFKRRHPQFFFVSRNMPGNWDGFVYDIDAKGKFLTGFLPRILREIESSGFKYGIYDNRVLPKFVENLDDLRDYQVTSSRAITSNRVGGVPFMRGIINAEMNAGKTYMMMSVFKSFPESSGIILLNDSDLYDQFMDDMPKFFKDGEWGYLRASKMQIGRVMVVMVQTLVKRLKPLQGTLSQMDIVCIDECDLATSKTYTKVLNSLVNTSIRIGLSGTIFLSKLKKYDFKINPIIGFTGEELYQITSETLIKRGFSSPIVVKIIKGNTDEVTSIDYDTVYRDHISLNINRNAIILGRILFNLRYNRLPIVIVCRFHEHVNFLYEYLSNITTLSLRGLKIERVHHEFKDRKEIFQRLKDGKIDILISSLIIKRGKNIPNLKVIINAAGGDSAETTLQVLGRGLRTHESKKKTYIEDLYDKGKFLERHSKHRINYYKNKKYKVLLLNK